MPTYNSDIYDAQVAAAKNFGDTLDDARRTEGTVKWFDAVWTVPVATLLVSDTVKLGALPVGVIPLPEHGFFYCETTPGTTLSGNLGDATTGNRYAAGSALALGRVEFITAVKNVAGVVTRHTTTEVTKDLVFTVTAVSAQAAGARVHFKVPYLALG